MRLAVWPVAPARALARALAGLVSETAEVQPFEAAATLREGRYDLALVPTLEILRDADGLALAPGVALAGERCPTAHLVVGSALDRVRRVAFDPRLGQEALLTQIVLREHFDAAPTFVPAEGAAPLAETLARADAALRPGPAGSEALPEGAVVLDLGQEWTDLTLRPMVWGLLAARTDTLDAETAAALADAVAQAEPEAWAFDAEGALVYQLTLDGYAHDGLDEFVVYLHAHGTLAEFPELPFVVLPTDGAAEEARP